MLILLAVVLALSLAFNAIVTIVMSVRLDRLALLAQALEKRQLDLEMLNQNMRNLWRREIDKLELDGLRHLPPATR